MHALQHGSRSLSFQAMQSDRGTRRSPSASWCRSRLEADSVEPVGGPPEQLLNAIKRDVEKWKKVVKEAKITVAS